MTSGAVIEGVFLPLFLSPPRLALAINCASASIVIVGCPLDDMELAVVDAVIDGRELELPREDPDRELDIAASSPVPPAVLNLAVAGEIRTGVND